MQFLQLMKASVHQLSINFTKADTKICLSLHFDANDNYFFVYRKEIFIFEAEIKRLTFQLNFVSEVYLVDLVILSQEKYL